MLYGKDSPILKSRTKATSQTQFGKLMSKSSNPKATMSEHDNLGSDEDEYGDEAAGSPMIYSIRPVEDAKTQDTIKITQASAPESSGEDAGKKPRSIFRHLFEPNLLTDGLDKDMDTMSLEMQCLDCLIKAPLTSMYCHAVTTHFLNLCVYCLATFQNGRQLEVHLLRHHRIEAPDCATFNVFDDIYKAGEVELFCTECNKPVVLGEKLDENEGAVTQHSCTSDEDEVLCCKCARQYSLKEIKSHIQTCEGQVIQKKNPANMMPLFMIKHEPEDIDLTKSSDSSPTKSISPVKHVEPARLRNRDNRCKLCLEIVPASKTAQHALACVGKSVAKPASSPEKVQTSSKRLTTRFQKTSPRRHAPQEAPSADSSINGGELVADPHNLTENVDYADERYSVSSNHSIPAFPHASPVEPCDSVQSNDIHTSLHQPHILSTFKDDVDIESASSSLTKETAEASCDMSIDHIPNTMKLDENPVPKYEDALLNEEDPDRRRSLLVYELCDFLERKYRDELRRNDNMDMRKRDVDLYQPITELTGDEILEIMISNACIGCTYCRQAKIVGVDRRELVIHLLTRHTWDLKFHDAPETQTIESTGDETSEANATALNVVKSADDSDKPKMKVDWSQFRVALLEKVFQLSNNIFNFRCQDAFGDCPCECLLCGCHIITQRQLFPHWIKSHARMSMKCYMCHENFLFAGALFSHLCFGTPEPLIREEEPEEHARMINGGNEESTTSAQGDDDRTALLRYQCRLCDNFQFPGFFNYTVHLRTDHVLCELCLQPLADQKELQNHILKKHKLNLYCWKCRFGYLDLNSFFSHMFWKHGNASVVCNKCCEKKWSFVYHFCRPPTEFVCDICKERFSKPMSLKVHKRLHSGEQLRKCPKHNCQERFISRKLLEKHVENVHNNPNNTSTNEEASESQEMEAGPTDESAIPYDEDETNEMRECPTENKSEVEEHQPVDDENKDKDSDNIIGQSEEHVNSFDMGNVEEPMDSRTAEEEGESTRQDSYSGEYTGSHQVVSPFAVPMTMSSGEFNSTPSGNNATDSDRLPSQTSEGDFQNEGLFSGENSIHSSTLRPEEQGEEHDSDKPFDISEFKGPNLSEDESDSEVPSETKRPKVSSPIIDEHETSTEKNQFSLDLNGHENFFDRIHSPDMANYEHLLEEDDNDMDANEGTCSDIPINLPDIPANIESNPPENEASNCQTTNTESTIQTEESSVNIQADTEDSVNIQAVTEDSENIQAVTEESVNIQAITEDLENIQAVTEESVNIQAITEDLENIQAVTEDSKNIQAVTEESLNIQAVTEDPEKVTAVTEESVNIQAVTEDNVKASISETTEDTTAENVEMGLPESIQSESSETIPTTQSEEKKPNCATDLHQDLQLSSDSSDDEETGEKETAECEGADGSVANDPASIKHTDNTTIEPVVSENGIHEPSANVFDDTDSSGNRNLQLTHADTNEEDLESQYKIRRTAEGIDPDSMPEHIRFDNAVWCVEHEHDYHRKGDPNAKDDYEKEQGRVGNGSPSRVADESSMATREFQRSTSGSSHINSTESAETSHSRKRTRSSSSSSSSSGSSSSGSSSGSSSDSSGSDSEEDDQSEDDNTSTSTPQSSSSPYKHHYSVSDNTYYDHPTYAAHQTSTPVASAPVKRGRGRPKGSLNRDKFGVPTAKKFQQNRSTGSNKASRNVDDAYKPRRKYRKTKGKGGRPKSTAALEKEIERRQETVNPNTIPESDLETEDSGSEDVFHNKQLTEPIGSKIPISNALWKISNEEYLLRLLRGVENLEKLRMITEMEAQAALAHRKRMEERMQQKQNEINTAQVPIKTIISTRKPVQQHPGPALNMSPPLVPSTPVRQAKVKIGKGRGRGRGRQTLASDRNNVEVTPPEFQIPVMKIDLGGGKVSTISTSSKSGKQKTKDKDHWCICRKPYDGLAMVECESKQCPYQWYHLDCLGLTDADIPKGKWYCRLEGCRSAKTRKRKRQNERLVGHYTH